MDFNTILTRFRSRRNIQDEMKVLDISDVEKRLYERLNLKVQRAIEAADYNRVFEAIKMNALKDNQDSTEVENKIRKQISDAKIKSILEEFVSLQPQISRLSDNSESFKSELSLHKKIAEVKIKSILENLIAIKVTMSAFQEEGLTKIAALTLHKQISDQKFNERALKVDAIETDDAPAAAEAYTQADQQEMVDLINELKSTVNSMNA